MSRAPGGPAARRWRICAMLPGPAHRVSSHQVQPAAAHGRDDRRGGGRVAGRRLALGDDVEARPGAVLVQPGPDQPGVSRAGRAAVQVVLRDDPSQRRIRRIDLGRGHTADDPQRDGLLTGRGVGGQVDWPASIAVVLAAVARAGPPTGPGSGRCPRPALGPLRTPVISPVSGRPVGRRCRRPGWPARRTAGPAVTTWLASFQGRRHGSGVSMVPSRTRVVRAAIAASRLQASMP